MPDRYFNFDSSSKSNQKSKTLSRDKIMKNRQILDKYFSKIVLDIFPIWQIEIRGASD